MPNSYSVSFRLRRITIETAHVSVPLTSEVWVKIGDNARLDDEKLVQEALKMGCLDSTMWTPDGEPEVSLHPFQTAPASTEHGEPS